MAITQLALYPHCRANHFVHWLVGVATLRKIERKRIAGATLLEAPQMPTVLILQRDFALLRDFKVLARGQLHVLLSRFWLHEAS